MKFTRLGAYFTPGDTAFADAGAAWLGWDIRRGEACTAPYPQYVKRPCKYGFHATLKPPFRLAAGHSLKELQKATEHLASTQAPVALEALNVSRIGSFFAFTPNLPNTPLQNLAADVVRALDTFRAAPDEDEIAKRVTPNMTEDQMRNLQAWGYPYVMESFRFHMTLSGPIPKRDAETCLSRIEQHFKGTVPETVSLDALTLVAERVDGNFFEVERYPLRSGTG